MKKKKIIIITAIAFAIVIILNFVVPAVLSPNQYKAEISQKMQEETGYKLDIGGNIKLSVLPFVKAYASDVRISTGARALVSTKSVEAHIDLIPLLSGKIQIGRVKIIEPIITLEKTESGNNWSAPKTIEASAVSVPAVETGSKKEVSIREIKIVDGEISYIDKGKETRLEKINITASLDSLSGPVKYDGKLIYAEKEIALKGSVENFAEPKIAANFNLLGTDLNFSGGTKSGNIEVKSDDIKPLLAAFDKGDILALQKAPLNVSGNFVYANDQMNITDVKAKLGSTEGIGAIVYTTPKDGAPQLAANLKFKKIYVDELMPSEKSAAEKNDDSANKKSGKSGGMIAEIQIAADEVLYKKGVYNNLYVKAGIDNKQISIEPFSLALPGGGNIKLFGIYDTDSDGKSFDGRVEIAANSFRTLLESFDIKLDSLRPGKPGAFTFNSSLALRLRSKKSLELTQISGRLQDSNFNGNLSAEMGTQTKITYLGGIDSINLDDLLVQKKDSGDAGETETQKSVNKKLDFAWLSNFGQQVKINTLIGQLKYGGQNYSNVKFDGSIEKDSLDVKNFYLNSAKINGGGKLSLNVSGERPKVSASLNIDKIDMASSSMDGGAAAAEPATSSGGRWSQKPINFSPLDQIDGDFKAQIKSLVLKSGTMSDVTATGLLENGNLNLQKFSTSAYDGKIEGSGRLMINRVPSFDLNFTGKNLSVARIVQGLMKNNRIQQGLANVTGMFKSSGVNQKNFVENLNGTAAITAEGTVVQGFDLQGFAYQVNNINSPTDLLSLANITQGDNKVTRINSITGNFYAEKGVISTQGIKLDAGYASGLYTGNIDLPKWYMDTKAEFRLTVADKKDSPAVGFKITGPLDAPKLTPKLDEIMRWAADRIAKGLIRHNVVPEKYKGLVDVLTGSGQQQVPATAAQPGEVQQQPAPLSNEQQLMDLFGKAIKKKK